MAGFRNEEEAIALANDSCFALSGSIWTRDIRRAKRVAAALSAGSCAVNDVIRNIVNPQAAFGGNGHSGYGRYHGPHGLYAFSRVKSVMVSSGMLKREINWFPFTQKTFDRLNALTGWRHGAGELLAGIRRLFLVAIAIAGMVVPMAG